MITPEIIAEIRAALEIIGNWKIGPPGGRTGFGKHFRYIYSDGISIRVSGDNSNVVAESVLTLRNHAPALLDEIERLRAENALQHSQLLEQAIDVLPERDAEIERLRAENSKLNAAVEAADFTKGAWDVLYFRARIAELEAERDEQNTVLREATQKLVELNVENAELKIEVAVLKEKLRTAEDFNENYTVIDDIGPLPKCFRCAHQQSMASHGPDAPCYQCGIDKGYPKFKEDTQ